MILSDSEILRQMEAGAIKIDPFDRDALGSNSYDVRLSPHFACYTAFVLDARKNNLLERWEIGPDGFTLQPGRLYLASTLEYTETHAHVPYLEGKSSTGRLGIDIHATAGKGDVGFCGHWTLEMSVTVPVRVYPGMPIGQLTYMQVHGDVLNPYGKRSASKYANQGALPQGSGMWKNQF